MPAHRQQPSLPPPQPPKYHPRQSTAHDQSTEDPCRRQSRKRYARADSQRSPHSISPAVAASRSVHIPPNPTGHPLADLPPRYSFFLFNPTPHSHRIPMYHPSPPRCRPCALTRRSHIVQCCRLSALTPRCLPRSPNAVSVSCAERTKFQPQGNRLRLTCPFLTRNSSCPPARFCSKP